MVSISGRTIFRCLFQPNYCESAYLENLGPMPATGLALHFKIGLTDQGPVFIQGRVGKSLTETFAFKIGEILKERIYKFDAERPNVGESGMSTVSVLYPNAANLPDLLNQLQTNNPPRFHRYYELVSAVFPEIKQIIAPHIGGGRVRISIWNTAPQKEREDLAMSLLESGTGIGQVMAILYVVLTSQFPRTIIIDEPQSFLHPGAVRKLFDILKNEFAQHQYVITTHSPTALTAADPRKLILVRKELAESKVEIIDVKETNKIRFILSEVGARLSDVFGADNILWVEGPTEEICFPIILSKISQKQLLGTAIIGVLHTGDFEGSESERIFRIYEKLSRSKSILPPSIGFVFDREGRTEREIEDLERESRGDVHFLNRRMFENYLLNPSAIAEVTSSIEGFRGTPVTVEEIENWLREHKWNTEYFNSVPRQNDRAEQIWLEKVYGTKILENLFKTFSENRVIYRKVEHGLALTN